MMKKTAGLLSLCLILCLVTAGCASAKTGLGSTSAEMTNTADDQTSGAEETQREAEYAYHTQEIWCENNGNRIYGIAYIPDTVEEKKPLVIFSHELGNSHTTGIPYAERLAEAGYAAYTFDFCGGTVGGNRSDGNTVGMSIMTEVSDLETVLNTAATWDYVDPERIVLLGGSQGGAVTALTGCRNQDKIAGMMLMYPAFSAVDDVHSQFTSLDDVPEEYGMFGGWVRVGRNYAADIWDLDFYEELARYEGDILLLHGDRDSTVNISYSERAAEVIPHCEYHVIKNGGHEFFNSQFEEAITYILSYMEQFREDGDRHSDTQQEAESVKEEAGMLKLTIGDTPVEVAWEENESVEALRELVKVQPLTIKMSMYSTFEQVGSLGTSLPRNDVQTTTQAGDIVLYSGNQIVIFYGSNSWAYTRLGSITDKTADEMKALLGNGDVAITISEE